MLGSESGRKTYKLGRALRVLEKAKGRNMNVSGLNTGQRRDVRANVSMVPRV